MTQRMKTLYESEKPGRGSVLSINQRFYHLAVLIATDDAQQYAQSFSILCMGKRTVGGIKTGLKLFELIKQDERLKPYWLYPELYKRGKHVCAVCGKVTVKRSKYCSNECRRLDLGLDLNLSPKIKVTRSAPHIVSKPCKRCGKFFNPKSNRALWCDECRPIAQAEYKQNVANPRDKERQRMLAAQVIKNATCVQCGKEFVASRMGAKYCSAKCHHIADSARKRRARQIQKENLARMGWKY